MSLLLSLVISISSECLAKAQTSRGIPVSLPVPLTVDKITSVPGNGMLIMLMFTYFYITSIVHSNVTSYGKSNCYVLT